MSTAPTGSPSPAAPKPGFWSQSTVQSQLAQIVTSSSAPEVKQGAIQLAMGCEAYVTGKTGRISLPEKTGEVIIPPGQFALLLVEEKVTIPRGAIGFISMRFGLKVRGLVNVSGFHVDPGFSGWLTFSVYNAGPSYVTISRGSAVFLLWLASLDQPVSETDEYSPTNNKGRGQLPKLNDDDIMNLQGEIASPGALKAELNELRKEFTTVQSNQRVIITLSCAVLVALFSLCGALAIAIFNRSTQSPPPSVYVVPQATPPTTSVAPTAPPASPNVAQPSQ